MLDSASPTSQDRPWSSDPAGRNPCDGAHAAARPGTTHAVPSSQRRRLESKPRSDERAALEAFAHLPPEPALVGCPFQLSIEPKRRSGRLQREPDLAFV